MCIETDRVTHREIPMKAIDSGIVLGSAKGTNRQSCSFPGICVLPGGRWICCCRAAPTKKGMAGQHVLVTWSDDQGCNWSEPTSPFVPPEVDGRAGLFRSACLTATEGKGLLATISWVDHSDPSLAFFNEETEGLLDTRIFLSRSQDQGSTWSAPEILDTSPFNVPTPITGPILCLTDGRLACQFELNKHYYDTSVWQHSSVMMFSADGGKTWPKHAITSNDPSNRMFFWDQRPSVLADGTILDLFWSYDSHARQNVGIHARQSTNSGHTWSDLWDIGVHGQPGPPVSTPDGHISMVYVDRSAEPIIKMRKSRDRGRTWPVETEMILYRAATQGQTPEKGSMQEAWNEMYKFSVGLPATAALPDGDILVVYYAGEEADRTDIRWCRVRSR